MSRPTRPFNVTIHSEATGQSKTVRVDPAAIPFGATPLAGSILDIAFGGGIDIDHACGGMCACSTCHVKVIEGGESCSPLAGDELEMLETARNRDRRSRLGCQCVPNGSSDLVVVVPIWFSLGESA